MLFCVGNGANDTADGLVSIVEPTLRSDWDWSSDRSESINMFRQVYMYVLVVCVLRVLCCVVRGLWDSRVFLCMCYVFVTPVLCFVYVMCVCCAHICVLRVL